VENNQGIICFGTLCFLGVLSASSRFAASPEDDVAAFVINKTALLARTRICWGGFGVVEAPIADASLADGQFWPSPLPDICTTEATRWGVESAGVPLFNVISITLAMVPEYFFVMRVRFA
jgi:hypothetical protein